MMLDPFRVAAWTTLGCALVPAIMLLRNWNQFRRALPVAPHEPPLPTVSVLIPARNEVARIGPVLDAVLASRDVELELVVLDDHSTDGTAELVDSVRQRDARVRLAHSQPLPPGWNGKQFACAQLAELARFERLLFLDADVQLQPDALARLIATQTALGVDLLSAFPRQLTETWGERLLIPLIPYILLCHLPFRTMRRTRSAAAAAGCGQLFLTTRSAYQRAGGHAAIRSSRHDGLQLPRAWRAVGLLTDIVDGDDIAACRMYSGFVETWRGLAKNATEGVARFPLLGLTTLLFAGAHLAPWAGVVAAAATRAAVDDVIGLFLAAGFVSVSTRFAVECRYHPVWRACASVPGFPLAIAIFLAIQWSAWFNERLGRRTAWRGRT